MTVGITGGIGSGKSTIAQALAARGLTVYDCDREAKRIVAENEEVQKAIIALLGADSFAQSVYNTSYVAKRVFAHPELLNRLNAIIHPAVKADICKSVNSDTVLLVESAVLYEAGLDQLCDAVIVVEAPEEVRIARVIDRDYHGEATSDNIQKVRARICAQEKERTNSERTKGRIIRVNNDGNKPVELLATEILKMIAE